MRRKTLVGGAIAAGILFVALWATAAPALTPTPAPAATPAPTTAGAPVATAAAGGLTTPAVKLTVETAESGFVTVWFEQFVNAFSGIVFYPLGGIPFVVWVLVLGSIFYTLRMGFINFRGFKHAIQITRGVFDNPEDPGEISHFQALTSALSATVGLGNIAGVAVAVGSGGPGAVFWMMAIATVGMTAKFVECTLAQIWRQVNEDGTVAGGPMYYLSIGLKEKGFGGLGKVLAFIFAVSIILGAFGGGNMFQANQSFELAASQVPFLAANSWLYGVLLAGLVGAVILGGIKRIGAATSKIVPFMALLYIAASLFIILTNIDQLGSVLSSIFTEAFSAQAIYGGTLGAVITGIQRAVFSNEAGIGSAAIAHSAAKTDEPVREGMVAMLGPFIDTIVICFMTASVLLITAPKNEPLREMNVALTEKVSAAAAMESAVDDASRKAAESRFEAADARFKEKRKGAELTSAAFGSVFSWFPFVLSLVVFLFAYSTMISWSYYGERGWEYLLGKRSIVVYRVLFLGAVVLGSVASLGPVIDFSDTAIFLCAFPNIIGGVMLSSVVRKRLDDYWARYQAGKFKRYI